MSVPHIQPLFCPVCLADDKLKFRIKTEGSVWSLSADEEDAAEGHKWVDALSKAIAQYVPITETHIGRMRDWEGEDPLCRTR